MKIFASEGYHEHYRENTLDAFSAAVDLGVDGVELDVRRSVDGALVVHHDATADGMVISATRRRELPAYIPTLEQAISASQGVEVNIEMKNYRHQSEPSYDETGGFARDVVSFVIEHNLTLSTTISCFDLDTCAVLRQLDDNVQVGWLLWDVEFDGSAVQARELGLTAVHPMSSMVHESGVTSAHVLDISVNAWTAREPAKVAELAKWNVDGLITDDPVGALLALGRT